jgi:hypothetical protein
VLFLDPSHERALANLDRLHAEKDDGSRTITMDVVVPVSVAAAAASPHARAARTPPARRPVAWIAGVAAALTLIAGAAFWFTRAHRTSGEDRHALALKTNVAADTLAVPRATTGTAKQPAASTSAETKPTMAASSSDAGATPIIDNGAQLKTPGQHAPNVKRLARRHPLAPQDSRRRSPCAACRWNRALSRFTSWAVWATCGSTESSSRTSRRSRKRRFPPATPVSCRMSEDKESHQITVNIRPEKETVIEYEVGATPVVSED